MHGALGNLRASNQIDNLFIEIGWEVTLDGTVALTDRVPGARVSR